jgi:hypothetical protein
MHSQILLHALELHQTTKRRDAGLTKSSGKRKASAKGERTITTSRRKMQE